MSECPGIDIFSHFFIPYCFVDLNVKKVYFFETLLENFPLIYYFNISRQRILRIYMWSWWFHSRQRIIIYHNLFVCIFILLIIVQILEIFQMNLDLNKPYLKYPMNRIWLANSAQINIVKPWAVEVCYFFIFKM